MSARENPAVSPPRLLLAWLMLVLALMLAACGKKGPLYLPDQATAPGTVPAAQIAKE